MKRYKHYSFDLWDTLIRVNPEFGTKMCEYFHVNWNPNNKTLEEVSTIISMVEQMCHSNNKLTGHSLSSDQMFAFVLGGLNNIGGKPLLTKVYTDIEQLFFQYPPLIYDENTESTLEILKSVPRTTMSILTNTGFVTGKILRAYLQKIGWDRFFDNPHVLNKHKTRSEIYSGDMNLCKPNKTLFLMMSDDAFNFAKPEAINNEEIIHVGNNPETDIMGATAAGIDSLLVNTNGKTIKDLLPTDDGQDIAK